MKHRFPALILMLVRPVLLAGCGDPSPMQTSAPSQTERTVMSKPTSSTATSHTSSDPLASGMITTTEDTQMQTEATTTLPLFTRLDFGTKSYAADQKNTTHEYIVGALSYNQDAVTVEFTEDTLRLTAKKDGTFSAAGEIASTTDSQYFLRGTGTCYYPLNEFSINFDNLITFDFEEELRSGYGAYAGEPFTVQNVGRPDAWRGYHQYMKIRIKNPTDNDKIAVQFNNSAAYASTQFMVMSIGKQKDTFETYIYDLCYAATYASGKGVLLAGQAPGNNWTWKQNTLVSGLRFHLLGSTCSYAHVYLNNLFEEGESAADYEKYQEYFDRLDSRAMIKAGNTVEIDYIVFGSSPEQLMGYHSYLESSSLAAAESR